MIKIINLVKRFKDRLVLKNICHEFPKKGLCIIYGPSGCGKTTLLNCIAGLLSFEGSIILEHQRLESMSDNELSNMRLKNYGFIFQDFKLFENETILANLLFPLETIYHLSKEKKKRKCQDLLSLVGLEDREKQIVNKLSGGEKQRVAIARALINDPKVVLADEPTGALDEKNGIEIMNILKIISRKALVIMVSHDQELTRKYADQIIAMEEGEIIYIDVQNNEEEIKNLPVVKNGETNKKAHIPDDFLLKHTYHNMKQKKARTLICYSMTSLGLIGVGRLLNIERIERRLGLSLYASHLWKKFIVPQRPLSEGIAHLHTSSHTVSFAFRCVSENSLGKVMLIIVCFPLLRFDQIFYALLIRIPKHGRDAYGLHFVRSLSREIENSHLMAVFEKFDNLVAIRRRLMYCEKGIFYALVYRYLLTPLDGEEVVLDLLVNITGADDSVVISIKFVVGIPFSGILVDSPILGVACLLFCKRRIFFGNLSVTDTQVVTAAWREEQLFTFHAQPCRLDVFHEGNIGISIRSILSAKFAFAEEPIGILRHFSEGHDLQCRTQHTLDAGSGKEIQAFAVFHDMCGVWIRIFAVSTAVAYEQW